MCVTSIDAPRTSAHPITLSFAHHLNYFSVISTVMGNLGALGVYDSLRFLALLGMTKGAMLGTTKKQCSE